jgi:hypothetical protein
MKALSIFAVAVALHAAEIRGTVVENQTGHPLSRATVTLRVAGKDRKALTNANGIFAFAGLPAGAYVVSAEHVAFAPVQYGQKRWHSRGTPVTLADGDSVSLTVRLPRYGAISGTVLDENDIGLPEREVAIYTDAHPPKMLTRAHTDDRGVYRFYGLQPGSYLVRSLAKMYDAGGYLPTFYRDSAGANDARPVEVTLDEEVERADFHAAPGRLFTVSGRVAGNGGQTTVTLSSDAGTESTVAEPNGSFSFNPVAPGNYDLTALSVADRIRSRSAGFRTITVDRNLTDVAIPLSALPTVQFEFANAAGHAVESPELVVVARRKDVAADVKMDAAVSGSFLPGRWEVALAPNLSYCPIGFEPADNSVRADGWHEILVLASPTVVKFVVSSSPAILSGTVRNANGEPVAGVPVYVQSEGRGPIHSTSTEANGQYSVGGLAPGVYRVLASFDYQLNAIPDMEEAHAQTVKVEEASRATLDIQEFAIR